MSVFLCRCVSCAVMLLYLVTLARIDVLPDDGPVRPKHDGVIN